MSNVNERALTWLTTALQMEEKGKAHYDQAAQTCKNEVGREIFRILSDYEVQHVQRIKEIYQSLEGGGSWSDELASFAVSTDLGQVFRNLAKQHEVRKAEADDVEALNMGIEFESASVNFYEDNEARADDALEKKFLELMVAEERGHLNLLTDMRLFYTDPESWFMEKERAGLDGA